MRARTRSQILKPIYELLSEAGGHLRDAHVAAEGNVPSALQEAHTRSLECPFFEAYRGNEVVNLVEVRQWVDRELEHLSAERHTFARGAYAAYCCALDLIKVTERMHGLVILPGDATPRTVASC